ncbi:type II toxin-antitoxin system VapC family toxin [Aquiflexum sp.]|uniref:type II toxin-antitoxin system VapC family toxin n=1 Tax=Aquiflexum sp. TaxID=1872584 RepID=UPI0035932E55
MAGNQAVICDTNIIIELFKDNQKVKETCLEIGINNLYVSPITIGEFYYGALNKREIPLLNKHLERFGILPLNENISSIFVDLMRKFCLSHKPFIGDMLIAATALHYEIEIYTFNTKDFHFIPNLKLVTTV